MSNLTTTNISLHTIPFAWLIAITPRIWARRTYISLHNKDLDLHHPRNFSATLSEDTDLDAQNRGRLLRAEAAMDNGLDNIGLFAAAIVAGNSAGLSPRVLNALSVGYLGSRVIYNYVYIQDWVGARVASFFGGLGMCFALLIMAGKRFGNSS